VNYKSVASLNKDVVTWLASLPRDIEVIVGVPRSGLLVANLLALHLNLPMTDVRGLLDSRLLASGQRFGRQRADYLDLPRNVFMVDDSVLTGSQMRAVREQIQAAELPHSVKYGAVYVTVESKDLVDDYYCDLPVPRVFEWNVMHGYIMENACVDIDGVLCRDPSEEENDDGPAYREFIRKVSPLYVPTRTVGWLVTSRLEKYRGLTEEWLQRHGIQYGGLIMMDFPDKQARVRANSYAAFKAAAYDETGASLFIESSLNLAREVARLAGKDVLCTETWEMVGPTRMNRQYRRGQRFARLLLRHPFQACWRVAGSIWRRVRQQRRRAQHRHEIREWLRRRDDLTDQNRQ